MVQWTIPTGSTATAQSVFVFDRSPGSPTSAIYKSQDFSSSVNTFTIPSMVLQAGQLYSISVQSDVIGITGQLEWRSRSFTAGYVPTTGTFAEPVVLPAVSSTLSVYGGPVYTFDTQVTANTPVSIDPATATGFIYQIGTGDPNFASVELPDVGNPGPYDIYLWNGSQFVFDTTLAATTVLPFGGAGISEFEVLGISSSVGLNPANATDFITTLTFEGSGSFTGTMTPIVSIPEPATWATLLIGFAGLGYAGYRRARADRAMLAA